MPDDKPYLREFCAENATNVHAAIAAGADRIELCDNLAVGGTSPSGGVIQHVVDYAAAHGARTMCMVRPRGGDFVYHEDELQMMEDDAALALGLGADGIVFGCLKPLDPSAYQAARTAALSAGKLPGEGPLPYEGGFELDLGGIERLLEIVRDAAAQRSEEQADASDAPAGSPSPIEAAPRIDVTFHMAFDSLEPDLQLEAIDELAKRGVTRILTHGGAAGTPIEENLPRLRELMAHAAGKLTILPGAGISYGNADEIAEALGARELHGTKIVRLG